MDAKLKLILFICIIAGIALIYIALSYIFAPYIFTGNIVFCRGDYELDPTDITVDSEGNFYIWTYSKYFIHKFNSDGKFVKGWGDTRSKDIFYHRIFTVDSEKDIYAVEYTRNFIRKYDQSGKLITRWVVRGDDNGNLPQIRAIAIDISGNVLVTTSIATTELDYSNGYVNVLVTDSYKCIQKFTSDGIFVEKLELPENNYSIAQEKIGDIAVDTKGNIYVAYWFSKKEAPHTMLSCIYKYDASGKFIDRMGAKNSKEKFFEHSSLKITPDFEGNIFVLNAFNCIYKYDSSGNFLCELWLKGLLSGYSHEASSIAVDRQGNIYVVNGEEKEVQKFIPNPVFKLFN